MKRVMPLIPFLLGTLISTAQADGVDTLKARNAELLRQLREVHDLSSEQVAAVRRIFEASGFIGQGNPAISEHPHTPAECHARLAADHVTYENPEFQAICGHKYMAPLYDPATQKPTDAKACIDQFEFPDIPCEYPVVWVRARDAERICEAMGKRLCDAHEWEGACDGALEAPDYRFDLARGVAPNAAIARMAAAHNRAHEPSKRWSYGPAYQRGICATASHKSANCPGGGWNLCGSNTYPTGDFPACHSPLWVYDLNGNAAEHMNLPLDPSQMASRGSRTLGYTEMKGSWFIFDKYRAHQDWCRWRAPFWHGSRVMDAHSHENYHLGFRCCVTLDEPPATPASAPQD
jgi:formylglycine-generating enzyme required for sulfatase activity